MYGVLGELGVPAEAHQGYGLMECIPASHLRGNECSPDQSLLTLLDGQ